MPDRTRNARGAWDDGALEFAGLSRVRLDALLQEHAVADIDATIHDLRASIFELRRQPGDSSLRADVQDLVTEYAAALGFKPHLVHTGPLDRPQKARRYADAAWTRSKPIIRAASRAT